jgi:hypothetical protein
MSGWNLPPGCTTKMLDDATIGYEREPNATEVSVRELLEAAKVPDDIIDKIDDMLYQHFSNEEQLQLEQDYGDQPEY